MIIYFSVGLNSDNYLLQSKVYGNDIKKIKIKNV